MRLREPQDPQLPARITRAYLLSLVLHVLLAALFVIQPFTSDATAEISGAPETVRMDQRAPKHQAVAMKAPPKLPKSAVVLPAAQKFVPRPRELSVIVPSASPMPTPLPQSSPLVALPVSPIALPSAALVSVR